MFSSADRSSFELPVSRGGRQKRGAGPNALLGFALCSLLGAIVPLGCSRGGEPPLGQRTFVWHQGDASLAVGDRSAPNPFRERVGPSKPLRPFSLDGYGIAALEAVRFHEGDAFLGNLTAPGMPAVTRIDPLDPTLLAVLTAPDNVLLDLRGWPALPVAVPARLSSTFPGRFTPNPLSATGLSPSPDLTNDFGGDFGGVYCANPNDPLSLSILAGTAPANPSSQCIESSSTGGGPGPGTAGQIGGTPGNPPNVDPGDPKGSYTAPSLTRMSGGAGENPMRPAPDRSNLETDCDDGGTLAQGTSIPSRGARLGLQMRFERLVDLDSGRPLVARDLGPDLGTCGAFAGAAAPDLLNAAGATYNSSFASHPFSVTPGAPVLEGGSVVDRRGGVGRDLQCLRPGGAPGEPNAFGFDEAEDDLANTNALQNHHADQHLFASLCMESLGREPSLDPSACMLNLFSTDAVLQRQLLPIAFVESLTALLAGEQAGSAGPQQFLGLIANNTKGAVKAALLPPVPLASLNMLFNNPANPFDRNLDGDDLDRTDCGDASHLENCDLGGFDGFDGRVQLPGRLPVGVSISVVPFVTLDKGLTNEQRALFGCGPFYASRCDSSLAFRDASKGLFWGGFGGVDFLNGEASAMFQTLREPSDLETATGSGPQPGTAGFAEPPVCLRWEGSTLVRLPGCRGLNAISVERDDSGAPVAVHALFEAGYLPSVDGCVIGTRVNRTSGPPVPVIASGGAPGLQAELALCDVATTRRVVPNRLFLRDADGAPILNPDGTPQTVPNPACLGPAVGTGSSGVGLRVCNSQTVTLPDLPLLHPIAGCVASDAHFPMLGADDCRYWAYRDLVEEFLAGRAQIFRSEIAAATWNLAMFLTVTSCTVGVDSLDDPECFDPALPYAAGRCSLASPQLCRSAREFLDDAPAFGTPVDGHSGQGQGGWGAPPHGNNPGSLLHAKFASVFPDGLVVGDPDGPDGDAHPSILLTDAQAVTDYLPAGGKPQALTQDHTNPLATEAGVMAGQLVTATINTAFDSAGIREARAFGEFPLGSLGELRFRASCVSGELAGLTVQAVIDLSNAAIAGEATPPGVTIPELKDALSVFNENGLACSSTCLELP